ncbi:MAG: FAD-dependent oxidoreductase [Prosthecobacter sp.]|uniref:FAD-dependent oxidoreductase n=1 Tax=Prosthecobacter sp. TaxID=1965333 RepID=UPI0025E30EB6|nr:FAD-dependent oxidoreductase [Prosthecobacter sp.]MCF7784702.1 FAD-dependent oxidoreductase [Prosthecobacter sp.]
MKLLLSILLLGSTANAEELIHREVIVYGGTPAGIMAAIAAARQGHDVALVEMNAHVGGMVSGGLVATDMGDRATVGGLADDFFKRIVQYYTDKYGADSKELKAARKGTTFEPHVAELIFEQMLAGQPRIQVWKKHRYHATQIGADRSLAGNRVTALVVDDLAANKTRTFTGDVFIDASYEGDLMAGAKVPYRVGREGRSEYGEQLAGVSMGPKEQIGMGDHRTQAYNYRVSITSNTANRVLFPKPEHYDPSPFIPTDGKRIKAGEVKGFGDFFTTIDKAHPGAKYDANWGDFAGNSEGYAEGSWETRGRIAARIRDGFLSRLYYSQNDPDLPEAFRNEARTWGLPKDEFVDNGNWPFQLYIREGRRMLGAYVLREQDLTQDRWKPDGIATGSYGIDCHVVQHLRENGKLVAEHTRHVAVNNYDIPYRSIVPPDVENLLVPVCVSASHVACCSLRMEPVYMMLGQAAGTAAGIALADKKPVQNVDAKKLRSLLVEQGAVLDAGYQPQLKLTWTPARPKPGDKVIFKAIPTSQNKNTLKQIQWDFTGNGTVAAEGERVVHVFEGEKIHNVSLLVADTAGRRRMLTAEVPVGSAEPLDVTLDEFDAELAGRWNGTFPDNIAGLPLRYSDVFHGPGIHRDQVVRGKVAPARAHFQPTLPREGRYQVCLAFRPSKTQATNTPVVVKHAEGSAKLTLNQRQETTPFIWVPLGEYHFKAGNSGFLELRNADTDGRIAVDGARWIWLGK